MAQENKDIKSSANENSDGSTKAVAPTQEKPATSNAAATSVKKKAVSKKTAPKKKTVSKKKTAPKKVTAKKSQSKKAAAKTVTGSTTTKKTGASTGATTQKMEKMMTQGQINFEKLTKEATEMGRENVEAFIQSGTVFAQGFENIMRTAMGFAQKTAEKQSKFVKEAMTTKTLNEFTEMQNKIAQASFDDFMTNSTKLTELSVKTLNESIEPINAQVTKGMQKATKMAA